MGLAPIYTSFSAHFGNDRSASGFFVEYGAIDQDMTVRFELAKRER